MGKREVTRRQLLAGVAGATGIGASLGTGTAAMIADEAVFRGGSIRSGRLDLDVAWAVDGDSGTSEGLLEVPVSLSPSNPTETVALTLSMPDDGANNPAFPWLRAGCPDPESIATDLTVVVRYPRCDTDCVLYEGSVAGLADGIALDPNGDAGATPGGRRCLEPGERLELAIDLRLGDVEGYGSADVTLEFAGRQCRNAAGTVTPFPAADCGDGPSRAISYLAFCTSSDGALDPRVHVTDDGDDGPHEVWWETAIDVDYVCVKAGTQLTIYDYRAPHMTSNQVWAGDPEAAISGIRVQGRDNADPCGVAAAALTGSSDASMQTTKLEWTGTDWEVDA